MPRRKTRRAYEKGVLVQWNLRLRVFRKNGKTSPANLWHGWPAQKHQTGLVSGIPVAGPTGIIYRITPKTTSTLFSFSWRNGSIPDSQKTAAASVPEADGKEP